MQISLRWPLFLSPHELLGKALHDPKHLLLIWVTFIPRLPVRKKKKKSCTWQLNEKHKWYESTRLCVLFPSTCINMLASTLSCEISKPGHPWGFPEIQIRALPGPGSDEERESIYWTNTGRVIMSGKWHLLWLVCGNSQQVTSESVAVLQVSLHLILIFPNNESIAYIRIQRENIRTQHEQATNCFTDCD